MTRILVLRLGALGDLLLAVPALRAIGSQISQPQITLVGRADAAKLLEEAGVVDRAISQDDRRLLSLFMVKDRAEVDPEFSGWDVAIGWLKDEEGTVAANLRRLGAKQIVVAPSTPKGGRGKHVADHLLASLSPLGLQMPEGPQPRLNLAERQEKWAEAYLATLRRKGPPVVAMHPGSGGRQKNWPAAKFARVSQILAKKGVVPLALCGPADELAVREMTGGLQGPIPVLRDLTLPHLAALLANCAAYLGNDSGVSHLASLIGVPTVALFGPTDPEVWGPRGERVTILRWLPGHDELSPEEVASVVLDSL